jgi:hypothetical protein
MDALGKCLQQVKNHERIMVSVSGGADSDAMLDLIIRVGGKDKTTFVFHNTGLEYDATKRQLRHLEEKYGIEIQINPPVKPIPLCVREHGAPFWSKYVAEMIERLQRHGFQWEDEPLEVLLTKYPRCVSALKWWCNEWKMEKKDSLSTLNEMIRLTKATDGKAVFLYYSLIEKSAISGSVIANHGYTIIFPITSASANTTRPGQK